jgi:hypothetical protein
MQLQFQSFKIGFPHFHKSQTDSRKNLDLHVIYIFLDPDATPLKQIILDLLKVCIRSSVTFFSLHFCNQKKLRTANIYNCDCGIKECSC